MPFLVIPNEVTTTTAVVWVAAINEAPFDTASAVLSRAGVPQPLKPWSQFSTADGSNQIQFQRVLLSQLTPGTAYAIAFSIAGQVKADALVTTLPDRLPIRDERPFTVFLGSCFFGPEDKDGIVGRTYFNIPPDARPHIKILCGDQVYLDNPPLNFIIPRGRDWLEARSFKAYSSNWSQSTSGGGGFTELLKRNANFFSCDDHEFWNNAPDRGLNVLTFTLTQGQRNSWLGIGHQLFDIFQTPAHSPLQFNVGPLSFLNADTRYFREPAHGNFMRSADLTAIGNWAENLKGPGVLVIGQPLFSTEGSIKDWGLPDFKQYPELVRHLRAAKHSIVILTGDVHFGRVAVARLRPELGTQLIEIISSPMQLVPLANGRFGKAPDVFGSVVSEGDFSKGRNHFLTLEFIAASPVRTAMTVKVWPISKSGASQPETVKTFELI